MGSLGAFNVEPQMLGKVGTSYPFKAGEIINLDSSDVVIAGDSPSGAHSDIFHEQLAWVAAAAAGLNTGKRCPAAHQSIPRAGWTR